MTPSVVKRVHGVLTPLLPKSIVKQRWQKPHRGTPPAVMHP